MKKHEIIEQLNDIFIEYIDILPFIELQDNESFPGKHHKLRVQLPSEDKVFETTSMIFFELQYLLHRYNEKSDTGDYKMLVSKLILSPKIPDTAFRQGIMIKISYIK